MILISGNGEISSRLYAFSLSSVEAVQTTGTVAMISRRFPCPFQRQTAEHYKGAAVPDLTRTCQMGPSVRIRFPPAESPLRT